MLLVWIQKKRCTDYCYKTSGHLYDRTSTAAATISFPSTAGAGGGLVLEGQHSSHLVRQQKYEISENWSTSCLVPPVLMY